MTEEMQTEIEKRIEEELDSIWNRDRKDIEYKFKNFDTGFQAGAKFILELPELREAVEALRLVAEYHGPSQFPQDGTISEPIYINKAHRSLIALKALGIVK